MFIRKSHLPMIAKIAWSFQKTTGLDFQELHSEAQLAYCEAVNSFNSDKGVKLSTWIYTCIQHHLINYIKQEMMIGSRNQKFNPDVEYDLVVYNDARFNDLDIVLSTAKPDVYRLLNIVLVNKEIAQMKPKFARGEICRILREEDGWKWQRIWLAMRKTKEFILNENGLDCII